MKPIKTLLIDNYDSFTHNLYHLITRVNSIPPTVIRNNEKTWKNDYLSYFDNIVISPGPGHPERETDFGLCHDVLKVTHIPVLGICLGYQGICALHGARIDLAPEPRHGRISPITHHQCRLFRNIPSPFSAVRYHSLAVYDLPKTLEPLAWSDDGLIMAVAHHTLPLFGVQFHPESICTEYGETLLLNFREITRLSREKKKTFALPGLPNNLRQAFHLPQNHPGEEKQPGSYTILHQQLPSEIPAETLFDAIFRPGKHAIWLDSNRNGYDTGRFSILCDSSGPLGRIAQADVQTQRILVTASGKKDVIKDDFFDWLEKDLRRHHISAPQTPFAFALGWVGYIGYEMKSLSEETPGPASLFPDAYLLFCDRAIVIDHDKKQAWLLALCDPLTQEYARTWLAEITSKLTSPSYRWPDSSALPEKLALHAPLKLRHNKTTYLDLITQCKEALRQGESYEICLTNMAYATTSTDPWNVWRILRQSNPAPYGAYLQLDEIAVLSCSPERFLSISRERIIESRPIKGTRPRSANPVQDEQLKNELLNSEKERAENLMIVDLVRNDLGRIAKPDSVNVPRLFDIESYQTVHQMVSTVTAEIRDGISSCQCVRAAFPGGSMTGAPKRRTLEIIDRLEAGPRGIYSGTLGYFSLCGAVDLSIIIRTLVMSGGQFSFGMGGAITALSDPEEEFEETRIKAQAFLALFDTDF